MKFFSNSIIFFVLLIANASANASFVSKGPAYLPNISYSNFTQNITFSTMINVIKKSPYHLKEFVTHYPMATGALVLGSIAAIIAIKKYNWHKKNKILNLKGQQQLFANEAAKQVKKKQLSKIVDIKQEKKEKQDQNIEPIQSNFASNNAILYYSTICSNNNWYSVQEQLVKKLDNSIEALRKKKMTALDTMQILNQAEKTNDSTNDILNQLSMRTMLAKREKKMCHIISEQFSEKEKKQDTLRKEKMAHIEKTRADIRSLNALGRHAKKTYKHSRDKFITKKKEEKERLLKEAIDVCNNNDNKYHTKSHETKKRSRQINYIKNVITEFNNYEKSFDAEHFQPQVCKAILNNMGIAAKHILYKQDHLFVEQSIETISKFIKYITHDGRTLAKVMNGNLFLKQEVLKKLKERKEVALKRLQAILLSLCENYSQSICKITNEHIITVLNKYLRYISNKQKEQQAVQLVSDTFINKWKTTKKLLCHYISKAKNQETIDESIGYIKDVRTLLQRCIENKNKINKKDRVAFFITNNLSLYAMLAKIIEEIDQCASEKKNQLQSSSS